ncbi:MAG: DEAD/DEAH box helicase family protein [Myxococcales bacterium]|nr:DEAD/DEAH box helicase family protein [Myxococcales bacterium]
MWRPGSKLAHPFNPELGVGVVRSVEGRFLVVYFPSAERELTLAAEGAGLTRLILPEGARARLLASGEEVRIARSIEHRYLLSDGREVDDADLWPLEPTDSPIERLAAQRLDALADFRNRIDGLKLMTLREAGGLGSFLGGRIELFPHQLHTALRAVEQEPVRWLLADEVGLGKTIEACLIISALVRTGRTRGALIVAPSTLTVQWLGELYRKFHQIFVLLDHDRIESVETDFGEGLNPFDVHPFAVISMEMLGSDRRLARLAAEVSPELVVVDEAHRLAQDRFKNALSPLVANARHALLLTATPLQADRRGFWQLLSLLQPDHFCAFEEFERALERSNTVVPCTSAVRRVDLGGLPPRRPRAIDLPPPDKAVSRDPRARWIADHVRVWFERREKVLIFLHEAKELETLKNFLESSTRTRMMVFHEGLSAVRRDIEVAGFRESQAPVLLCSEAGAEGRNFQFCDRMIHYDLPWDPVVLEQRIGRLDRIGRTSDVEIIYFRHEGASPDVARLYERLDLFSRPSAALDVALTPVRQALKAADGGELALNMDQLIARVDAARKALGYDVSRVVYRDGYDRSRDAEILARVPPDLELRTRSFCVEAAHRLGLKVVEKVGRALYYIELGEHATVDSLPGVAGGTRYLGTFDRLEAIHKDEVDFFASGHALVEGLLLELEDGPRGRSCLFEVPGDGTEGVGLLCLYKEGPRWQARVVDREGKPEPAWAERVLQALPAARSLQPDELELGDDWVTSVRAMGAQLERAGARGQLVAAALFRFS